MKIKTIMLTILLTVGISFQSCERVDTGFGCGDSSSNTATNYFDIKGFYVSNYKKDGPCCTDAIAQGDSISFQDFSYINVRYLMDYIALNNDKHTSGFSFMSSLNACSPVPPGMNGSKTERLKSLYVVTLNDFDSSHFANDTINDLLVNLTNNNEKQDLNEYLAQDTGLIKLQELSIGLKVSPFLNNELKYKVIINLFTGEKYQANSIPFRIIN